jgi:prepilin-type N-terminal cleavage/methylation domain-containing protein
MNSAFCHSRRQHRRAGFSMVEMIGVLAIIAILAVIIVPKVFATIASARVTNSVASVTSMQTAITDFAGKYGTIPTTVATSRLDDLLITAGILDARFTVKLGTQPANPPLAGATWANTTGSWVATTTGAVSQATQSRIICLNSNTTAPSTAAGANYQLTGSTANLPSGSRVVSAVIPGVSINDARELSLRLDGESMTQPVGSTAVDSAGKVVYGAAAGGLHTVYVYIAHQ